MNYKKVQEYLENNGWVELPCNDDILLYQLDYENREYTLSIDKDNKCLLSYTPMYNGIVVWHDFNWDFDVGELETRLEKHVKKNQIYE